MATNNYSPDQGKEIQIKEKIRVKVDYKEKIHPVLSVCTKGTRKDQLKSPSGVAVDSITNNIYVSDTNNNHVKVFDDSGKFLFKFGCGGNDEHIIRPKGLVISGNRVFISDGNFLNQSNRFIFVFQLNGYFITKIRKYGKSMLKFSFPSGLACDESNGDIYICDFASNCIRILYKDLPLKSQFGADELRYPLDVKLSKEYIYILDASDLCVHLYDYNHNILKSVVSKGRGMQVLNSNSFFVDNSNNIFAPDYCSCSINIFNSEFEIIHKINTTTPPMGVVLDNQGRIIVVCQSKKACLQIF